MSETSARARLWEEGIIAPWYLYDYQKPVYEFLIQKANPVFEATRRFGKTTTELVIAHEELRTREGWVWRWCEPWKEQARKIVMPEMEIIQDSCPFHLRAKFYRTDSFYEFPKTGARLYLLGVNEDRGESARGSYAHRITADELGSWVDPQYILNEVLLPQLLTTRGQIHKMSTPPKDLGHYWYTEKEQAIRDGRFIQRIITDVDVLSDQEREAFIQSMGGRTSTAVRRELFCEPVSDPELLVIPEYDDTVHDVPDDYPRPEFFDAYVFGDQGHDDNTALLFAYVDFLKQELVIEDEFVISGKNTELIMNSAKERELALWKKQPPCRRIMDANKQLLYDYGSIYQYWMEMAEKDEKEANYHHLRVGFQQKKIKIKKRCANLRYQLKVGLWKDDKKSDFKRDPRSKHLDAIAALYYGYRIVNWRRNPFPQNPGATIYTHLIPESSSQAKGDEALASLF